LKTPKKRFLRALKARPADNITYFLSVFGGKKSSSVLTLRKSALERERNRVS